jgi:DNA-binding winged helix-turn-helix (wHTH) protein
MEGYMQSVLVISDDPAFAETLASELPELSVTGVRANDAEGEAHKGGYCLTVIDGDANCDMDNLLENSIKFTRPIRLNDVVYAIAARVKSKTILPKEEMEFAPGCLFLPTERQVRSADADIRIALTEKEVELLQKLILHDDAILSRDILLKYIWGYGEDINTHTLETHIYRLRGKLRQLNGALDIVFSEEGGYRLNARSSL